MDRTLISSSFFIIVPRTLLLVRHHIPTRQQLMDVHQNDRGNWAYDYRWTITMSQTRQRLVFVALLAGLAMLPIPFNGKIALAVLLGIFGTYALLSGDC